MEGIEILSVGEIGIKFAFNWSVAIIFGLAFGVILGGISATITDDAKVFFVTFLVVGIVIGLFMGFSLKTPTDTVPSYKVIIDDTVSLNEFYNNYEILEQDGKIFTITERRE